MYYTSEGTTVKRYNVCTSTQLPDFATNLPGGICFALRIRSNGEVMVACDTVALRLNAAGGGDPAVSHHLPIPAPASFFASNLDPDGTSFWTGDYPTGHIYKIDIATGAMLLTFTAPPQGTSMAGLAIYGELTQGLPSPTPTATGTVAAQYADAERDPDPDHHP